MTASNLLAQLKDQAKSLGFSQCAVTHTHTGDLPAQHAHWLAKGFHGEMDYLMRNQALRADPSQLHQGTLSIISLTFPYLDAQAQPPLSQLSQPNQAYISRYALGRDYHKLMRKRLQALADWLSEQAQAQLDCRVFVDSAPVFERHFAEQAGLGWQGKNTLLLNERHGSFFFLGEIFTNLPLASFTEENPQQAAVESKGCGSCSRCLDFCPTQAFVVPGLLDARRCISYLTIEHPGDIPLALRPLMGNRIYGCDDCQLVCPWNKFALLSEEADFKTRHHLDQADLLELFDWSETEFQEKTAGMAIHRIGYTQWQRNLAVALGNSEASVEKIARLKAAKGRVNPLVDEHIDWAIAQLTTCLYDNEKQKAPSPTEPLRVFLPKELK